MGFFSRFTDKSWQDPGLPAEDEPTAEFNTSSRKVGLIVFLAVVSSIFMLFFVAYIERMELSDWYPVEEPKVLWFNTFLLVLASLSMQRARKAAASDSAPFHGALLLGGLLAIAFLVGQYAAWEELRAAGMYAATNPASAFFYLLTALHGVHLLGGIYVWARTVFRSRSGAERLDIAMSIELCSVYWHYLLILWLLLFALMLNT